MNITSLGESRFTSPVGRTVDVDIRVPEKILLDPKASAAPAVPELLFELAGPRSKLFFDPKQTRAGGGAWLSRRLHRA